jgi:hypothetical protein
LSRFPTAARPETDVPFIVVPAHLFEQMAAGQKRWEFRSGLPLHALALGRSTGARVVVPATNEGNGRDRVRRSGSQPWVLSDRLPLTVYVVESGSQRLLGTIRVCAFTPATPEWIDPALSQADLNRTHKLVDPHDDARRSCAWHILDVTRAPPPSSSSASASASEMDDDRLVVRRGNAGVVYLTGSQHVECAARMALAGGPTHVYRECSF